MFAAPLAIRSSPLAASFVAHRSVRRAIRNSQFTAPFPINCFPCSLFKVRYSKFAVPFVTRRTIRHSQRRFLFIFSHVRYSSFDIQCSPHCSPFAAHRAIRRAIRHNILCRFSMSPDAFHTDAFNNIQIIWRPVIRLD